MTLHKNLLNVLVYHVCIIMHNVTFTLMQCYQLFTYVKHSKVL